MRKPIFLLALTLLMIFVLSPFLDPDFANFDNKISNYHIKSALEETESPNVVTSIVWDYRAYDTLGEETILFAATLGIYSLFVNIKKRRRKIINIFLPRRFKR